jgi:uncharacterized protein
MSAAPRLAPIDRIGPTQRPALRPAGTQRWRDLLFLHWSVPADALRPIVPSPLELDDHGGRYWVGVVPFVMRDVRSAWMPRGVGPPRASCRTRFARSATATGERWSALDASASFSR